MRTALRRTLSIGALSLACGVLGCAGGPAREDPRAMPTVPGREKIYTTTGPGNQVEQVIDPEFHMAAARRDFAAGLRSSASREIEKLAAFVDYEAERASGRRRRALDDSRDELEKLSRAVGRGEVENPADLDHAFAHARAALKH